MGLPRLSKDWDRLKADLDAHGYCLVADALPPEAVSALRTRLETQAAAERTQGYENRDPAERHGGSANQWVYMLINKGRVFRSLLTHEATRTLVGHVVGPDFLLSSFSAHITHPGGAPMALHTDQWWMPQPVEPGERRLAGAIDRDGIGPRSPARAARPISPAVYVNIMWTLCDFTEENGATRFVPGSHLSGAQPQAGKAYGTVAAEAPAGTALAWDGRTWHAAGVNRAMAPRYGVQSSFCGPQFRTMENYTLGTRPEVLAELAPEIRAMLGFKIWSGYGNTGDAGATDARPGSEALGELA